MKYRIVKHNYRYGTRYKVETKIFLFWVNFIGIDYEQDGYDNLEDAQKLIDTLRKPYTKEIINY